MLSPAVDGTPPGCAVVGHGILGAGSDRLL